MFTLPENMEITDVYRPNNEWRMYYCRADGDVTQLVDHAGGREISEISQVVFGSVGHDNGEGLVIELNRGDCNVRLSASGKWTVVHKKGSEWACWTPTVNLYQREAVVIRHDTEDTIRRGGRGKDHRLLISAGQATIDGALYLVGDVVPFGNGNLSVAAGAGDVFAVHVWR